MSVTQPARYNLDLPSVDDEMEMVTSPYRQADNSDIDLELMNDPTNKSSLDEPEYTNDDPDAMQADTEVSYQDDDMIDDEEFDNHHYDPLNQDLNMEAYNENNVGDQDEDIIFDEEIEVTTVQHEPIDDHKFSNTSMLLNQDQDQDQDHNQARIDTTDTTQEAHAVREHDEDQQDELNADAEILDNHEDLNNEPTTLPGAPSAQDEMKDQQTRSGAGHSHNDHIADPINYKSPSNPNEVDESVNLEQNSNTIIADESKNILEKETDGPQQPAAQDHEELRTTDSNEFQVVEPEQLDHSAAIEPHLNDDDEAPSNEPASDLHPVVVTYLGQEMSFFPPSVGDTSATFFLADPTLAYDPFEKLLVACRSLLGESLEHDDELVLDIPTLGLHISEDSKYASELGLAQVLEVYLALSRNERADTPEPLYCHLSSRVCLSSQYSYLITSAQEGKCYSEIAADYAESPEEEVEAYDEASEHQEKESDDRDVAEGTVYPEHEADVNSLVARPEAQEEPVFTDVHVTVEGMAALPSLADDNIDAAFGVDAVENTQTGDTEVRLPDVRKRHDESTEPSETVLPGERELQATSGEQEDLAIKDRDVEPATHSIQSPSAEQYDDAQTPSSHTVEADHADSQQDIDEEQLPQDQIQFDDDRADVTQVNGDYAQDDIEYSDEELFNDDDPTDAATEPLRKEDTPELEEDLFAPQSNGHTVQGDAELTLDSIKENKTDQTVSDPKPSNDPAEVVDDYLDFEEGVASVPVTPSKSNGNKRKALDVDDELAFFDIGTPEPKRRRPS